MLFGSEVSGGVHLSNVADVANVKITKWRMKPSQDLVIETVTGDQIKVTDQFEKILQNDSLRFENVSTRSLTNEAVTLKEVVILILKSISKIQFNFFQVYNVYFS